MNTTRLLGSLCAVILASSLGAVAACGGSHDSSASDPASTASVVNSASVSIALTGATGANVGQGSGVLLAPNAVLTSAHLISGQSSWVITSADGKTKVTAHRGMTYDWLVYDSDKSHPRRHDVGVLYLDSPINLAAYPSLASSKADVGASATRLRGTGAGFEAHGIALEAVAGAPNAYLTTWGPGETLDTGGAVFTDRGLIGIVSGVGQTTNKLYIARTDGLVAWLAPKVACAGGALATRAYATPAPKAADCDAGPGSSSGAPGSSSGGPGSSSGGPGSSSGGPGSSSGGPGGGPVCTNDTNGHCQGDGCGSGGIDNSQNPGSSSGAPGSSSGNPGASSSGAPGSNTSGGIDTSQNPGSANPGGSTSGAPGSSTSGAPGSNTSGGPDTSQNPGSSSGAPGSTSGSPGSSSGGGASAVPAPGNEPCSGPSDNPDVCPPEANDCSGPTCGGGQPDDAIDFGSCGCNGASDTSGHIYLK